MFKIFIFLLILYVQQTISQHFQDDNLLDEQLTIILEDNLGDGSTSNLDSPDEWTERSVVTVKNAKLGQAKVAHTRPWTDQLSHRLKNLADAGDFYKMRMYHKNGREPVYVLSFTDACLLYSSRLTETVSLLLSSSMSLTVPTQSLAGGSITATGATYCQTDVLDSETEHWQPLQGHNTTLLLRTASPAIVPDTATFIQKMESLNKEKLENKDNRSFIAKYWMYIIPFVLLLIISNGGQDAGK